MTPGRLCRHGIRKRRRPATKHDAFDISTALTHLRAACSLLRGAGAHHAADYVARAHKSATGAHNHTLRMVDAESYRQEKAQ